MPVSSVSYLQEGEGQDLVFLHGYLSSKESFYHQIEYFKQFYRVTAFDFWGMGKSPGLDTPWTVDDYASHTRVFLREAGVRRGYLIAHSFGGRVALKLLSEREPMFERALLTGCAGLLPKRGARYALRVKSYRLLRRIAPKLAEKKCGSAEYRSLSPVMRESFKKIVNEDLAPCAEKVGVPVLYVFGDRDTATPPYMAEKLHGLTRGSGLVYLKGCTHFCFCEKPGEFNAVAREFFR